MQIKINLQPTSSELQLITEGLRLLIQHLEDGEAVSIVGSDPQACLFAARALVDEIGLVERRGPGEYKVQTSFLGGMAL